MTNNQLTDKRARLRKAAQDYQTALSWYQENLDNPNAEQDCDEAAAAFKREIAYREMDIIADLLNEIGELQEHRKAAAEPVRYLNKFSGACVTLEQQPNAADDIAVYMPLYASSQPLTDAGEHFQRGYDEGHSRGLTCGKLYKGDDQMRQHRAECVKVYRAEINGGEID
ncbi:hypothetical protein NNO02_10585 [Citrobacter sp. Awk 2]|uniref:hypothetical protein n=1 Tax=Citrobacter sp. Awk 2 TaxID=2963959 RepID=UPI002303613E|nr:hypothetical protein [Citrobacter sp. Awk 2]MDA8502898.1 hypothetical protein [Citrobacter sp. Awk 2]